MKSTVRGSAEVSSLNESPSQKEGKFSFVCAAGELRIRLNESPSQKEGK